jgi:hypothetical protein
MARNMVSSLLEQTDACTNTWTLLCPILKHRLFTVLIFLRKTKCMATVGAALGVPPRRPNRHLSASDSGPERHTDGRTTRRFLGMNGDPWSTIGNGHDGSFCLVKAGRPIDFGADGPPAQCKLTKIFQCALAALDIVRAP